MTLFARRRRPDWDAYERFVERARETPKQRATRRRLRVGLALALVVLVVLVALVLVTVGVAPSG